LFILKTFEGDLKDTHPVLRSETFYPEPLVEETLNAMGPAIVDQSLKIIV
jgi:hypothetical protein